MRNQTKGSRTFAACDSRLARNRNINGLSFRSGEVCRSRTGIAVEQNRGLEQSIRRTGEPGELEASQIIEATTAGQPLSPDSGPSAQLVPPANTAASNTVVDQTPQHPRMPSLE